MSCCPISTERSGTAWTRGPPMQGSRTGPKTRRMHFGWPARFSLLPRRGSDDHLVVGIEMVEFLAGQLRGGEAVEESAGRENVAERFDVERIPWEDFAEQRRHRRAREGPVPGVLVLLLADSRNPWNRAEHGATWPEDAMERPKCASDVVDQLESLRQDDAIEAFAGKVIFSLLEAAGVGGIRVSQHIEDLALRDAPAAEHVGVERVPDFEDPPPDRR